MCGQFLQILCFLACLFKETGSPGNNIGGIDFHTNIQTLSECQLMCQNNHDTNKVDKTCDYFTYYDKTCLLKTTKAKWNLLYKTGRITGTRQCSLEQENGKQ